MLTTLLVLLVLLLGGWAMARFYLQGPDLSRFDMPRYDPVHAEVSAGHETVLQRVGEFAAAGGRLKGRERLRQMRDAMESLGADVDVSDFEIKPANANGVPAEWITSTHTHPARRLLYIHGGAFTMGSPRSHRGITTELARRTGYAILAIDYRLMPEHSRQAGIEDCQTAYRWLTSHGPDGVSQAERIFVAGDSAGGNLTLMLIAWVRDQTAQGKRLQKVDGAIALSPLTDATFASPSISGNIDKDPMLGAMAAALTRLPRPLLLWMGLLQNRMRPSDPRLSPVYGDLAGLPPTLVQASEAEILIDDARRYVNKARAAGSPAELETWHGMVHVWQAFGRALSEADEAFARMADFIAQVDELNDTYDRAAG